MLDERSAIAWIKSKGGMVNPGMPPKPILLAQLSDGFRISIRGADLKKLAPFARTLKYLHLDCANILDKHLRELACLTGLETLSFLLAKFIGVGRTSRLTGAG
jgi:hypothetical protein